MRFVIDESSFVTGGLAGRSLQAALVDFLDLLEDCRSHNEVTAKHPDLYRTEVGSTLMWWLDDPDPPGKQLPRDLRVRLWTALERCVNWEDHCDLVELETLDVLIAEQPVYAPSVAFVHHGIALRQERACLVLGRCGRKGRLPVERAGIVLQLHFIEARDGKPPFYQDLLELENVDEEGYFTLVPFAFPNLVFALGSRLQFRNFSRPYRDIRLEVTRALALLSDEVGLFRGGLDMYEIMRRMKSLGVEMSPESPNTKANKKAWAQRKISHDGREIHCEWHVKLSKTIDRIHFHPGNPDSDENVIIGIFTAHLDT